MASSVQTARAVVFDIRESEPNNSKFISSVEALYEVCLLAHAGTSRNVAFISLVLVGAKGFETFLSMQPLIELDKSFKRAFGKLKQMMRIPNQSAIYSSTKSMELILEDLVKKFKEESENLEPTQLEVFVITATDEVKVKRELNDFLSLVRETHLNQLAVIHFTSSPETLLEVEQTEHIQREKLPCWMTAEDEEDLKLLFKSWLNRKRKNWKLEISGDGGQCEWRATIDIEDLVFDLNGWPNRISANFQETAGIGLFQDATGTTLDIIYWVKSDGVQEWLIHGLPRRLSPAGDLTEEAYQANYEQFCSLSCWLEKEQLVGIARLLPCNPVIDYYILKPGSDGSLLLRNIAPRELILPPSPVPDIASDDEQPTLNMKEVSYEDIYSAYSKLPECTPEILADQLSIVKTVEFHILNDVAVGRKQKQVVPKPRKARR